MGTWSIGEVEAITGVKSHILRYWEEIIPSFAPKKDLGGRRVYTLHDIHTVIRLKYLIQEKKFTIEGARNQLITEDARLNCPPIDINGLPELTDETTDNPEKKIQMAVQAAVAAEQEKLRLLTGESLQMLTEIRETLLDSYSQIHRHSKDISDTAKTSTINNTVNNGLLNE